MTTEAADTFVKLDHRLPVFDLNRLGRTTLRAHAASPTNRGIKDRFGFNHPVEPSSDEFRQ